MTAPELLALLPYVVLATTAVLVMLSIAARRSHGAALIISLLGLAVTLAAMAYGGWGGAPQPVTDLLVVDPLATVFLGLTVLATVIVALLAAGYLQQQSVQREEFYVLLLTATLGAATLAASSHFASLFLSLELLSVSLYGLIAYQYERPLNLEAGIKYLVLAGVTSAFLLFGMALLYSQTGDLRLPGGGAPGALAGPVTPVYLLGALMVLVGMGFKLALVPFHMWSPDIYQGAPAPVAAFLATVSKGGVFAVLLRCFLTDRLSEHASLYVLFVTVAIVSMLVGNLLALLQTNLKRLLGYSSIAHLGYLLVPVVAGGHMAAGTAVFYLVAYFVTMLAAFGVVAVLSGGSRDAAEFHEYQGLAWRRPWLTAVLTTALLSLAGVPVTAGFMGKAYLLANGAEAGEWVLLLALVAGSAISIYYYLRVIMVMFGAVPEGASVARPRPVLAGLVLGVLLGLLLGLGAYPGPALTMLLALMGG
ncbi:MAG: NADH-quinone oxidoreductase subunit N [Armatimonadetes bacterium]|nr:NADH-quinone oxidoreductase subunit N [Armatimonadota bacterium]